MKNIENYCLYFMDGRSGEDDRLQQRQRTSFRYVRTSRSDRNRNILYLFRTVIIKITTPNRKHPSINNTIEIRRPVPNVSTDSNDVAEQQPRLSPPSERGLVARRHLKVQGSAPLPGPFTTTISIPRRKYYQTFLCST